MPPLRYVFITDALLNILEDDEVDAVFAHELGHAKHRHIWLLLSFLISMTLVNLAIVYLLDGEQLLASSASEIDLPVVSMILFGAPLLLYFYFGFGYLYLVLMRYRQPIQLLEAFFFSYL